MANFLKKTGLKLTILTLTLLLLGSFSFAPLHAEESLDLGTAVIAQADAWDDDVWGDWDDDDWFTTTSYGTQTTSDIDDLAALGIIFGIWGIVMLPLYIYFALSLMTIAKKLNVKNAWLAWIPIANIVLFLQCAGLSPWLTILFFIPFVNFIAFILMIYGYMKIAERRGFESWIGILVIVPVIGIAIPGYLAWAEAKGKTE